MPLSYSQFTWGFEVFDSGVSQNNKLDVNRTASNWAASTAYLAGNQIMPSGASASSTQLWQCTTAGTSGASQPAWPASPVLTPTPSTVSEGALVWTFVGFVDNSLSIPAGVYTADELASKITQLMTAADTGNGYSCTFSFSTLKFTIAGSSNFTLKFAANPTMNCRALLGFNAGDKSGAASYTSDQPVGTSPSTASLWTMAEPLASNSPVGAQSVGTPAKLLHRAIAMGQHISDSGIVESVYIATIKRVTLTFRALPAGTEPTEQTKMESFLDWAAKGKKFTWQPDKASTNVVKLVIANPGQISTAYEWLTRPEIGYAPLTFIEQTP